MQLLELPTFSKGVISRSADVNWPEIFVDLVPLNIQIIPC